MKHKKNLSHGGHGEFETDSFARIFPVFPVVKRIRHASAFTLIELLVVMAIIAILLTLAVPRYFNSLEKSRETVLRQDLALMRDAIDKFYGDRGKYPETLDELASQKYLRRIPTDPFTDSDATWIAVPPAGEGRGAVYDIKSGAAGQGRDGLPYREW